MVLYRRFMMRIASAIAAELGVAIVMPDTSPRGAAVAGCWMDTGEGGLSPYHLEGGCDIIMQIGTAKYGVRDAQGGLNPDRLVELAKAIAPECPIEIVGIRPGEKIHESLITPEEGYRAINLDDRYVIGDAIGRQEILAVRRQLQLPYALANQQIFEHLLGRRVDDRERLDHHREA
mgnify:CR=1 FL=1